MFSSDGPAQALDVPIAAPEPLVVGYAAEDDQFFDAPEQHAADAASVRTPRLAETRFFAVNEQLLVT